MVLLLLLLLRWLLSGSSVLFVFIFTLWLWLLVLPTVAHAQAHHRPARHHHFVFNVALRSGYLGFISFVSSSSKADGMRLFMQVKGNSKRHFVWAADCTLPHRKWHPDPFG